MLLILLVLAAAQLRALFAAAWLGTAVEAGLGVRAVLHVLTRSLTVDLGFLVVAALVLWGLGGAARNLGRAFDLACVAVLPLLFVDLAATVVARALELAVHDLVVPELASLALTTVSFTWAGVLVALSARPARRAGTVTAVPGEVLAPARRAGWGVAALAAVGAAVQVTWIVQHADEMRPMTEGDPAPELALPSIGAAGAPGPRVTLAAHRGKVVVLDFWATWCNPCLKAMPALDALARAHADLVVITINLDDPAAARAMWDERGYALQLVADDGEVSNRYGVSTIPHTVVIDRAGVVRMVARGGGHTLEPIVRQLLAEQIRK